jgi:hypothetical protein
MPRCYRFFAFPRREEGAYPQRSVNDEQRRRGEKWAQPGGRGRLGLFCHRCSLLTGHFRHARRSRLAIQPKALPRDMTEYLNRLLAHVANAG